MQFNNGFFYFQCIFHYLFRTKKKIPVIWSITFLFLIKKCKRWKDISTLSLTIQLSPTKTSFNVKFKQIREQINQSKQTLSVGDNSKTWFEVSPGHSKLGLLKVLGKLFLICNWFSTEKIEASLSVKK
jgi:hypothetical protein